MTTTFAPLTLQLLLQMELLALAPTTTDLAPTTQLFLLKITALSALQTRQSGSDNATRTKVALIALPTINATTTKVVLLTTASTDNASTLKLTTHGAILSLPLSQFGIRETQQSSLLLSMPDMTLLN
jgi:hypothetical protein